MKRTILYLAIVAIIVVVLIGLILNQKRVTPMPLDKTYSNATSGVSFMYPASLFDGISVDRFGTVDLEKKGDNMSPIMSVAVFSTTTDKISDVFENYRAGEERLIASSGKIEVAKKTKLNGIEGYYIRATYENAYIYYFITQKGPVGKIVALELIARQESYTDKRARETLESTFKAISGSIK